VSRIWAVTRQMIAEGLRMKIALVLLVLIGLVLVGLPFSVEGDGSLSGTVRSFMSYSLTATGLLLSFLTIFMSRSLSDELVNRQILVIMTKPIPRWQFMMGKWLGMILLNAAFLVFAGLLIYGMVRFIVWSTPPRDPLDEADLHNEVLVARHATPFTPPDFMKLAEREFQRNLELGKYSRRQNLDPEREKKSLATKHEAMWRIVPPLNGRIFRFENILCDRSEGNEIQLRYKAEVVRYPPDEIFRSRWVFGDPRKGVEPFEYWTRHVVGRFHTISFPARCVADDHTLTVLFFNENPFEGERQSANIIEFMKKDGVEILFVVGSFEGNLVRLLSLMMCKLMFLGAIALLMASVFSFPVACLASFTVYLMAGIRSFIYESLDWVTTDNVSMFNSVKDFLGFTVYYIYRAVAWVIPDFSSYDAVETFVNGRNVTLVWVLSGIAGLVLIRTTIGLGLAMLLFHRREVSEVSV
jgi:hypothetical protein